jgi:hypothetical protein
VKFVENHAADMLERRVGLQHARQDSLGHDFDPGAAAHARLEPGANADGLAHRLADEMRHALCDRAGRNATRLEHQQGAPGEPVAAYERERDDGAFAGARRRLQENLAVCRERFLERRKRLVDRERREFGRTHGR